MVPAARVEHAYEFAKGGRKWFLLERNRWWTVIGDYPAPLLLLVLPPLLAAEPALLALAGQGGWLGTSFALRWRWYASCRESSPAVATSRPSGAISAGEFARRLTADLDSPYLAGAGRLPLLPALQRAYWRLILAVLR